MSADTHHQLCPKCRALGLSTDCSDRLRHERTPVSGYDQDEYAELHVTISFGVLVAVDEEPLRQKALALHDDWTEDPEPMLEYLKELGLDYTLQVHTPTEI